jgi:hypothetical protein
MATLRWTEVPLNFGHRHDALVRVLQMSARFERRHSAGFDEENAGDDLKAIGDAMLHLLQQQILLTHQLIALALQGLPIGHVLEGEQNVGAVVVFIGWRSAGTFAGR